MASPELYWQSAAGIAVVPLGVIEHLDVVEDIGPRIVAVRMYLASDTLMLE